MFLSAALFIAHSALADTVAPEPITTNSLAAAIESAEVELRAAQALGNAWLHSEALIARAKKRARDGDRAGAMALVLRAREQSELAQNQAKLERARYLLREQGETYSASSRAAAEQFLRAYDGAGALHVLLQMR